MAMFEFQLRSIQPRTLLLVALAMVGTVVVVVASVTLSSLRVDDPPAAAPATATTRSAGSVVNKHPLGPARVTTGEAYAEYASEIEAIHAPLPSGAEYPEGVPEALNSSDGAPRVVQPGTGRLVAQFTWLCAWETEYLAAVAEGDSEREAEAEARLIEWSTSSFYKGFDTTGAWARAILDPALAGDRSGIHHDHPQTCANAFIVNVRG